MNKQNKNLTDAALLRQNAEEQLKIRRQKSGSDSTDATSKDDLLKLIYELEVHQIELEMQNEQLLNARVKAEKAEEKYTELYDYAPSAYISLSKGGVILELNFAAAAILGNNRKNLINKRLDFFISNCTQTTFSNFLQDVFTIKTKHCCKVIITPTSKPELEGQTMPINVSIGGNVSNNNEFYLLTLNDITDSVRAKKELQESEEKYRVSEFDLKKHKTLRI